MARVAVVGSANLDLVVRTHRFPQPGETLLGGPFAVHPGGKGANQAVAAGLLGADVAFVGTVGADPYGQILAASLIQAGVDVEFLLRAESTPSGVAQITVSDHGQNTIVVAPGANALTSAETVGDALSRLQPAVTLVSLEIPLAAVAACAEAPGYLIVNPAPAAELPDALWSRIDLLTPNESEAAFYSGVVPSDDASCLKAAASLFDQGARRVLITLGGHGAFLATPEGGRHFPHLEVKAIDTTAAGDAFNGALATFLAEGRELDEAIHLANCVGALACTKQGAQEAMPTREALCAVVGDL